ncbi:MAG: site-2 protease family protein [Candidatus Micrarchaeota archaeon]
MIPLMLIIVAAIVLFYSVMFLLDMPGAWKFAIILVEMAAVSQILIRRYKMPSELGFVLVKSRRGIEYIESLAKNERLFNFFADSGTAMSYGLLSLGLMRKNVSPASTAFGIIMLFVISLVVAPVAMGFLMYSSGIGAGTSTGGTLTGMDYGLLFYGGMLLLGGLFLLIMFGIVFYGVVIFKALVTSLFFGTDALANTAPGGDILLPGVNLPLLEGIAALIIVLVVHEGAHAILARIAKIPLLSSGIVFFGIIPIGAFVEPDERKLVKAEQSRQTRVLVAGPTANMFTALGLFAVFLIFFFATSGYREGVLIAASGLPSGTNIYSIDGQAAESIDFATFSLDPDKDVVLETNRGEITRRTDGSGKLGIDFYIVGKDSFYSRYPNPFLGFIHVMLGLALALNFVVGTVNILPIPLFDGYRIVDTNVRNKMVVKALSYGTLFFFILNFLPRLFQ